MKKVLQTTAIAFSIVIFSLTAKADHQWPVLPAVKQPVFKKDTFNIVNYGAKGDGITLNTVSINNAIAACNKNGGGVVLIPSGLWLTGPVNLKSNVNLHLRTNALLQFTTDKDEYPLVESNWEGLPQMRNQSPLWATNETNIAITGGGIIDGGGDVWRLVKREKLTASQWSKLVASGGVLSDDQKSWYPSESFKRASAMKNAGAITPEKTADFYKSIKDFLRPNLLVFTKCSKILLEGVTFQNSPAWCLHPLMSEDLTVRNIFVRNPWYAQNGDGIDVESCKNVLIENSIFDVGDDGICIKSGRDAEGRKRGMPTENVTVRNCTVYHAHGGFVVGSEMSGGAKNIYVDNCTFVGTDIGLRFKTTRGRGGVVENIHISNISMKAIPGEAILFDMYYGGVDPIALAGEKREAPKVVTLPVTEETPQFQNFHIENVTCLGARKALFIRGLPEMSIKNIVLENMVLQADEGIDMTAAENITLNNIRLITKKDRTPKITSSKNIKLNNVSYGNDAAGSGDTSWTGKMAYSAMTTLWKDSASGKIVGPRRWSYDQGVVLKGIEGLWKNTGDKRYFDYIQKSMDAFVDEDGNIRSYRQDEYNIDHVLCGRNLLMLYKVTGKEKYYKAVQLLRGQLKTHPRTNEGGFWHKKIYPYQMWLDGLYMGQPFYAEYAATFHEDTAFNDIAKQFILMERHSRDSKTGLLYHGYDESRQQRWADKATGRSPHVWGRAMGWYGMGLVDALEWFPVNHPQRGELIKILSRFATAITAYQDKKSGLWWDIVDMPGKGKNYEEASASCMIVYALAKGVRLGYLPEKFLAPAKKGYDGIIKKFVKTEDGLVNLHGTVSVSGLGGNPYRDGSFDYYMREKVIVNDPKGVGAFLLMGNEINILPTLKMGKGKTVVLDNYFNQESQKDITGTTIPYHYVWEEMDNNGFSLLGHVFNKHGVATKSLREAPTAKNLKEADIYLIVDPDTNKENPNPNFIEQQHINAIYDWVNKGGVLLLFANDPANVETVHFNNLTKKFGIQLNAKSRNMVKDNKLEMGTLIVPPAHEIFKTAGKIYLKEICTLTSTAPARAVFTDSGDEIMAVAKVGKGTVFVVGDPWMYNEYLDGRKLPAELENYKAAEDLVKWAIK